MIVPMITVDNLVKRYPKRPVNSVDDISFQVTQGEAFGLLGPNGAGKSTTIGTITTRVRPTGGQVLIGDVDVARDPVAARRRLAVVPQRNNLDRALTARENLLFHGAYFGYSKRERAQRADALLQEFGLGERGEEKTDKYSGGMAQRLMIARALMHDPELLVLDEPTTGVDPQARLFVWDRISELNKRGLTLLLTTHDMVEVERLCTRVAIMDHGKILAIDTPEALKAQVPGVSALELGLTEGDQADDEVRGYSFDSVIAALAALPGVEGVERIAGASSDAQEAGPSAKPAAPSSPLIRLYSAQASSLIAPALKVVADHGAEVNGLRVAKASLEDVFIHLTGRTLR